MIGPLLVHVDKIQRYFSWTLLVHDCEDAERCLLLLYRQSEIDWDASFAGKTTGPAVRFFHYDFTTGEIPGLAAHENDRCKIDGVAVVYKP